MKEFYQDQVKQTYGISNKDTKQNRMHRTMDLSPSSDDTRNSSEHRKPNAATKPYFNRRMTVHTRCGRIKEVARIRTQSEIGYTGIESPRNLFQSPRHRLARRSRIGETKRVGIASTACGIHLKQHAATGCCAAFVYCLCFSR